VPVKPQKPASQYADYVKNLRTQPIANKYGVGNSMPVKAGGGGASGGGTSSIDNSSENSNSRSRGSNYSGMNSGIPVNPQQIEEVEDGHEVVATARGTFDSAGGVLTNVETGVSIFVPQGAIIANTKQEIYFKVCREVGADSNSEQLLSPMVMCGPHGLNFKVPVELRLPHNANATEQGWQYGNQNPKGQETNQVSVLIDHF